MVVECSLTFLLDRFGGHTSIYFFTSSINTNVVSYFKALIITCVFRALIIALLLLFFCYEI